MNVYGTQQIRNVILLGHGGAGKTTVAEALAHVTGITKRLGSVPEGNTLSDYNFSTATAYIRLNEGMNEIVLSNDHFNSFFRSVGQPKRSEK